MKRSNILTLLLALVVLALSTSTALANEPVKSSKAISKSTYNDFTLFSEEDYNQIEDNMLAGIKSDNTGLQTSCAYFLGEMKSDRAMIPLLKLVTNGKTEESRIIAALSLYKIKSRIGMYRLKRLSESYEESELVRNVFDRLYEIYVSKTYSF
jgi:hypothetical protein